MSGGCESLHVQSVPVKEGFDGHIAWEGSVEVFELVGHPKAKRAYGWNDRDGKEIKAVVMLGIPPVNSPQTAVKAAVALKGRSAS